MVKLFAAVVVLEVGLCAAGESARADVAAGSAAVEHLLVKTSPGCSDAELGRVHARAGVARVDWACGIVPGLRCVSVPTGTSAAALAALRREGMVEYAELDRPRHKLGQSVPAGIAAVHAPLEWPQSKGRGVIVAHLDTGIDLTHPDLPVPVATRSFVDGFSTVQDGDGHGTHTAGIIAARNNTKGVVGVAPAVSLIVGKVLDDQGGGNDSGLIAGIDWAVQNHARVISMSLGGYDNTQSLRDACKAARAAGVLLVCAAGNDGSGAPSYPASYPSVVSVSAVDSADQLADFSNFGPRVMLTAPGVDVLSTYVAGPTVTWSGVGHDSDTMTGSGSGTVAAKAIYCGFGEAAGAFPAAVSGKIAHIRRGGPDGQSVTFAVKVQNAIAAGARAVIISNNVAGRINGTLGGSVNVPVVEITRAQGDELQAISGSAATVCTDACPTYEMLSGTSMSCPHVAGVAALLFGVRPAATPGQVLTAMERTAVDLGAAGRDDQYGYGLVQADLAARYLVNHAPRTREVGAGAEVVAGTAPSLTPSSELYLFLQDYFAGSVVADIDEDGVVGVADLYLWLGRWGKGE